MARRGEVGVTKACEKARETQTTTQTTTATTTTRTNRDKTKFERGDVCVCLCGCGAACEGVAVTCITYVCMYAGTHTHTHAIDSHAHACACVSYWHHLCMRSFVVSSAGVCLYVCVCVQLPAPMHKCCAREGVSETAAHIHIHITIASAFQCSLNNRCIFCAFSNAAAAAAASSAAAALFSSSFCSGRCSGSDSDCGSRRLDSTNLIWLLFFFLILAMSFCDNTHM